MIRAYLQLKKMAHRAKPDAKFRARLHESIDRASIERATPASASTREIHHTFLHPYRLAFASAGTLALVVFFTGAYAYQSTSISPTHPLYDMRETLEDAESDLLAPAIGNEEEVELKRIERKNQEMKLIDQELRSLDSQAVTL